MENLPRYKNMDIWHYRKAFNKLKLKFSIMLLIISILLVPAIFLFFKFIDEYITLVIFCGLLILLFVVYLVKVFKIQAQFSKNKKEGRLTVGIYTKFNDENQLYNQVCTFMQKMGYQLTTYNNEQLFYGGGSTYSLTTLPKYIKININGNVIIASCFILCSGKEYALGDYPYCNSLTEDMDNLSNYFDF